VRWTDLAGNTKTKVFDTQDEAKSFLSQINVKKMRGGYVDPKAGTITLTEYAELTWLTARTGDEGTILSAQIHWRLHIKPQLGKYALIEIKAPQLRSWLKDLEVKGLALTTQKLVRSTLFSILSSAVEDELIVKNPLELRSTRLDSVRKERIEPITSEQVMGIYNELEPRYRLLALIGAFLGLRQGEAFGLAVEDVDFLRGVVHVRRQVKHVGPQMIFALPKFKKQRDVPLPDELALLISAHLQAYPARAVTMPWEKTAGEPVTFDLITTTRESKAVNRNYFNKAIWRAATESVGLSPDRENGFHGMRHSYASVFLGRGGSIRDLAEYLGHSDPGFTLRVYTHLMTENTERMRQSMGAALGEAMSFAKPFSGIEAAK
jgi:integrase